MNTITTDAETVAYLLSNLPAFDFEDHARALTDRAAAFLGALEARDLDANGPHARLWEAAGAAVALATRATVEALAAEDAQTAFELVEGDPTMHPAWFIYAADVTRMLADRLTDELATLPIAYEVWWAPVALDGEPVTIVRNLTNDQAREYRRMFGHQYTGGLFIDRDDRADNNVGRAMDVVYAAAVGDPPPAAVERRRNEDAGVASLAAQRIRHAIRTGGGF